MKMKMKKLLLAVPLMVLGAGSQAIEENETVDRYLVSSVSVTSTAHIDSSTLPKWALAYNTGSLKDHLKKLI